MPHFKELLKKQKVAINKRLDALFIEYKKEYANIGFTAVEAIEKLHLFSRGGKGIRGGLFMLSTSLFDYKEKNLILNIAAALEILQSSLLVHDDIMDNDFVRRGEPSLFAQYIPIGGKLEALSPDQYGKSMGICVGDIGFFIAMDICNKTLIEHTRKANLLNLLHKELIIVGLAQMDDVTFAASKKLPQIDDVLRMYLHKTAHYTFSLPLSLGAIATNQSKKTVKLMEKLGEEIGLLFQIKDDEIGLTSEVSGKPLGSDIRENKKTIMRLLLDEMMSETDAINLGVIQNKKFLTNDDVQIYLKMMEKYDISKKIEKIMITHKKNAERVIDSLDINQEKKVPLYELISFVINRSS